MTSSTPQPASSASHASPAGPGAGAGADVASSPAGVSSPAGAMSGAGVHGADITLGAGCLGLAIACVLSPAHIENGPVICPFRALTGLPCPGCGMTRSWVYLTHGWWGHALQANALGVLLALAVVLLTAVHVARRVRGIRVQGIRVQGIRVQGIRVCDIRVQGGGDSRVRTSGGVDVMALLGARTTIAFVWAPWLVFAIGRMAWYGFTGATY